MSTNTLYPDSKPWSISCMYGLIKASLTDILKNCMDIITTETSSGLLLSGLLLEALLDKKKKRNDFTQDICLRLEAIWPWYMIQLPNGFYLHKTLISKPNRKAGLRHYSIYPYRVLNSAFISQH